MSDHRDIADIKDRTRYVVYAAFRVDVPSRSFDYSAIRVQTSAPASAALPCRPWMLDASKYVQTIRMLSAPQAAWVRYAYAERSTDAINADMEVMARHLYREHMLRMDNPLDSALSGATTNRERVMPLIQLAMEQCALKLETGRKRYSRADLYRLTGSAESSWQRDMQPHWQALQDLINAIDHVSLLKLAELFDEVEHRQRLERAHLSAASAQMRLAG